MLNLARQVLRERHSKDLDDNIHSNLFQRPSEAWKYLMKTGYGVDKCHPLVSYKFWIVTCDLYPKGIEFNKSQMIKHAKRRAFDNNHPASEIVDIDIAIKYIKAFTQDSVSPSR